MNFSGKGIARLSHLCCGENIAEKVDSLNLSNNCIFQLEGIQRFSQIRHLDLSCNKLIEINGIECLEQLENLNLSQNTLTNIELLALMRAKNMKTIDLSNNNLTFIDDYVLEHFKVLEKLDLSFNYLKKWPNLHTLNRLEILNLSGNLLTTDQSQSKLPIFLKELNIKENHIDQIISLFGISLVCQELEKIKIDGNPFVFTMKKEQIDIFLVICFPNLFEIDDKRLNNVILQKIQSKKNWKKLILEAFKQKKKDVFLMEILDEMIFSTAEPGIMEPLLPPPPPKHLFKVEQVSPPDFIDSGTVNSGSMSKRNKLNVTQQEKQKTSEVSSTTNCKFSVHPHLQPQPQISSSMIPPIPSTTITTTDSSQSPHDHQPQPSYSSSFSSQQQQQQLQFLQEQLNSMRKYMNIWIKREQIERTKAAKKIQEWFRHFLKWQFFHRRVFINKIAKKQMLIQKYGIVNCSTFTKFRQEETSSSVVLIQKHIRGYLIRQRVFQFRFFTKNAIKIQTQFRLFLKKQQSVIDKVFCSKIQKKLQQKYQMDLFLLYQLACPFEDVVQLQRLCLAQEETIQFLWQEIHTLKINKKIDKA